MKRLIALFLLAACAAQAGVETVTVELENQSDHAITGLNIWEVRPDGSVVDDALANFDAAIAAHATGQVSTDMIRCFDRVDVDVTYDDGHNIIQEADLCKSLTVTVSY
jgi:hypothetical protein